MIQFDKKRSIWVLETNNYAYSFGIAQKGSSVDGFPQDHTISGQGMLLQTWFGQKLPRLADYPEAIPEPGWASFSMPETLSPEVFPVAGGPRYTEPSLKLMYADSIRDIFLSYETYVINANKLSIILCDPLYNLEVELEFTVYESHDLFSRRTIIKNKGTKNKTESFTVESLLSGAVYAPRGANTRLTHLVGRWVGETRIEQIPLPEAKLVLESTRGFTSHHANPFFAIDRNGNATEENGDVWFGELAWSGNWKIVFDTDNFNLTKISAGFNNYDFSTSLSHGEEIASPSLLFGFTNKGFGDMSRKLHAWQRAVLSPCGNELRKVLYNSWEAVAFAVNEENQMQLAEIAAQCGVELFVVDDGWFGSRPSDNAGLGDWIVNTEKFPQGLGPLVEKVKSLGMEFGLWVEPEMINPNSDLYRAHPEWAYHYPGRTPTEMRSQLVLNLALPEVEQYVFNFLHSLLSEYDIRFIKWDLNRSISEPGSPPEHRRDVNILHIQAVYRILSQLRKAHPLVRFQTCSGGGGRVDIGILQYYDQVWPSDNTDASDRISIQEGFSLAYGSHVMESWVTAKTNWLNDRTIPLEYRFHVAMAGVLGIGENLHVWNQDEIAEARRYVEVYKDIRPVVQNGNLWRLDSSLDKAQSIQGVSGFGFPVGRNPDRHSFMYVSENAARAVLFVFLEKNRYASRMNPLYPRGLDPLAMYTLQVHSPQVISKEDVLNVSLGVLHLNPEILSGQAWMARGIMIPLRKDFSSIIIELRQK